MFFLKNNLPGLLSNTISNSASNAMNKFEKIIGRKEPEKAGKGLTLFISNEDIFTIVKQKEVGFLVVLSVPLVASVVQPLASSVVKGITGRRITRTRRE